MSTTAIPPAIPSSLPSMTCSCVTAAPARTLNAGPVHHAASTLVHMMDTSDVDTVLMDGRIVKRDGRLVGVDTGNVVEQLTRSAAGVISRAEVPSNLLGSCRMR